MPIAWLLKPVQHRHNDMKAVVIIDASAKANHSVFEKKLKASSMVQG